MKVVSCEKVFDQPFYELDTDEQVLLDLVNGIWEYQSRNDSSTYCSGRFNVEDGFVSDIFSLPEAVKFCLSLNFK